MNLKKLLLTKNACYISGKKMTPKGIMVYSTGANNPRLSRYVGPDDWWLGKNPYNNHWNTAKPGGRAVCVHGFIGLLGDGATVAIYQTLPWDMAGWHSGGGSKSSANNLGYIGFEICEDGLTDPAYFKKVYQEAVELCAMPCACDQSRKTIRRRHGRGKLAAVIEWVYPKIPAVVRLFITEAQLVTIIERVLAAAKAKWEANPDISSYIGMTASSHNHNAAQATPGALTFVRGGTLPIVHSDTGTVDAATAKANLGLPAEFSYKGDADQGIPE